MDSKEPSWEKVHPHFIKEVRIEGFLGSKKIILPLDDVSVVIGPNGSGKTTVLNILAGMLLDDRFDNSLINRFDKVEIEFNNSEILKCINGPTIPEDLKDSFKSFMQEKLVSKVKEKSKDLDLSFENEDDFQKVVALIKKISDGYVGSLRFNRDFHKDNENHKLVNIQRVSTFDMIMLDSKKLEKYPQARLSQLDVILNEEIAKLTKHLLLISMDSQEQQKIKAKKYFKKNINDISVFEKVLNELLAVTNKSFKIEKNGDFSIIQNGKHLKLTELSSGEKQLIYIMCVVVNSRGKDTILLMDEPEVSLSLNWQRNLLKSMFRINSNLQIILVSHSPAVVTDGWVTKLVEMEEITVK